MNSNDFNIDFDKNQIVPRLRDRNWNGIPYALWAEMFPIDELTAPKGEKVPVTPIVAFGIDQNSSIAFPEKKAFRKSGLSIGEIQERAMNFLESLNPQWEDFNMNDQLDGFPLCLIHTGEFATEQVLNKKFLAEAADRLDSKMIFVSIMCQTTCIAMPLPKEQKRVYEFISFNLLKYISNPPMQISPTIAVASNDGHLMGVVGYNQELYDDVVRYVKEINPDDSEVAYRNVFVDGNEEIEIAAWGSTPKYLFDNLWNTLIKAVNELRIKRKEMEIEQKDVHVTVIFIKDKIDDLDILNNGIEGIHERLIRTNEDMRALGVNGEVVIDFDYKESKDLI